MENSVESMMGERKKKAGRRTMEVKKDVRITSYYEQGHLDDINRFGVEIGSLNLSNTVRSIVLRFLKNHFFQTTVSQSDK